jgi:RNA polymerase sigma factor (sigma-70 family)
MKETMPTQRARTPQERTVRSDMTDEQIIERVRAGETRLFEELVRRYQVMVFGMARRLVGSDAEDVAQEAFLRVHRGLAGFKGDSRFSTWLYRITFNLCTDRARRAGRARDTGDLEDAGDVEDPGPGVERRVLENEEQQEVRDALATLDDKYRAIIVLFYYQGLSYEQIGEVTGLPVKTVETRLYRARRALRGRLEGPRKGGSA